MSPRRRKEPKLSVMQAAFRERFVAESPFREDRALAVDLAEEGAPVLEALAESLNDGALPIAHEASALLTLLSRRAGMLGATPAAAVGLIGAIVHALAEGDVTLDEQAHRHLTTIVMEGYCAGRDERSTKSLQDALARAHVLSEIAPRVFALSMVAGADASLLSGAFEQLERELLRRDAQSLVIELSALSDGYDDTLRLVGELCATAHSLGVFVVLSGLPHNWDDAAHAQRLDFSKIERRASLPDAVALALSLAGLEIKARRRWPKPLFSAKRSH